MLNFLLERTKTTLDETFQTKKPGQTPCKDICIYACVDMYVSTCMHVWGRKTCIICGLLWTTPMYRKCQWLYYFSVGIRGCLVSALRYHLQTDSVCTISA